MRLGIVSDTHGHVANTQAAVRMLEALEVELVIHCGDVGSDAIPPLFAAWPTHFVLGNVDEEDALGLCVRECGQTWHGRFGTLEAGGRAVAFLHGDDGRRLDATVASGQWDLICYGHTHVPAQRMVGKTLVLNPGALYRAARHTLAVVELPELRVDCITVA